jgi:hypothetical protein
MSTILTSTGIQFPDSTVQTSAGVSTASRPIFRGTFSAGVPYPSYPNDTEAYSELIPYTQIDTVGHSFGYYPQIDTHNGFGDYIIPSYPGLATTYTIPITGFYHISGMGNVFAQWNGTDYDLSGRFRYVDIYLTVNRRKIIGNAFLCSYNDYGIAGHFGVCTEKIYHCNAGDKIEMRVKSYKVGGANYPPVVYLNSLCGYYVRSKT